MRASRTLAAIGFFTAIALTPALAQSTDAEAEMAVRQWLDAVVAGTPEALGAVLAPEFQIQRANGTGHDRDGYIEGGAAQLAEFDAQDLVVTRHDDLMVVRYTLVVSETISGQPVQQTAPRLTVFRLEDGHWLVVAHANFAEVEQ